MQKFSVQLSFAVLHLWFFAVAVVCAVDAQQQGDSRNLPIRKGNEVGENGKISQAKGMLAYARSKHMSDVITPNVDFAGYEGPAFESILSPMTTTTEFGATEFQREPLHIQRVSDGIMVHCVSISSCFFLII